MLKNVFPHQGRCRCFCHPRVWPTLGRRLPPRTTSSVLSCSAFRLKAWMNEAFTAGTLRTATRSSPFSARGVRAHPSSVQVILCLIFGLYFDVFVFFPLPTGQTCVDIKDNVVNEGYYFTPKGDDPCLSCTCHDGEPEMCVAALCERPQGCQHFRKDPKECCKFTCLDPGTCRSSLVHVQLVHSFWEVDIQSCRCSQSHKVELVLKLVQTLIYCNFSQQEFFSLCVMLYYWHQE